MGRQGPGKMCILGHFSSELVTSWETCYICNWELIIMVSTSFSSCMSKNYGSFYNYVLLNLDMKSMVVEKNLDAWYWSGRSWFLSMHGLTRLVGWLVACGKSKLIMLSWHGRLLCAWFFSVICGPAELTCSRLWLRKLCYCYFCTEWWYALSWVKGHGMETRLIGRRKSDFELKSCGFYPHMKRQLHPHA